MTIEIPLSQLKSNGFADKATFDAIVDAYIQELVDHTSTIGVPRPISHPLVEAVITRYPPPPDLMPDETPAPRFAADYEVIDDTPPPPPPPTFDQKIQKLTAQVSDLALDASEKAWPMLTRRSMIRRAADAQGTPDANRSAEQIEVLKAFADVQAKMVAIDAHHGDLELQIYGLTEETVDGWQPSDFPA